MLMPPLGRLVYSMAAQQTAASQLYLSAQHAAIKFLPLLLQALCSEDWRCLLTRRWLLRCTAVLLLFCL